MSEAQSAGTTDTAAVGRRIVGAVLDVIGAERPYADSQPIAVRELHLDAPRAGEILVRIEAAGVCHSDLSVVNGQRPRPVPMLLGHEAAGIVEALGDGVTDLALGDRVVMTFLPRCGHCRGCLSHGRVPCEAGSASNGEGVLLSGGSRLTLEGAPIRHHLGVSGFASYAVVDRSSVVRVGADVPPGVAAVFGCALLTGGGALLNVIKPTADTSLAVVGLGGVGMAALVTAVALGVRNITGIDTRSDKLELARSLGATAACTPDEAVASGLRVDAAVEAAGHPSALATAIAVTGVGGTTVTVGLPAPGQQVALDPLKLTAEARTLVGSYLGSAVPAVDIPLYETMWRDGALNVDGLISATIRLEDINEAMDVLSDGRALRQIITFE